jgi:hypothetical protein
MKPISASKKTDTGYKKLTGIVEGKYGFQLVFYGEGKQMFKEWLDSPGTDNLYLGLKEWDSKPQRQDEYDQSAPF